MCIACSICWCVQVGTCLPSDREILLVNDEDKDTEALQRLARIGYSNVRPAGGNISLCVSHVCTRTCLLIDMMLVQLDIDPLINWCLNFLRNILWCLFYIRGGGIYYLVPYFCPYLNGAGLGLLVLLALLLHRETYKKHTVRSSLENPSTGGGKI